MLDEKIKQSVDAILLSELGMDPAKLDECQPIQQQVCLDSMQFVSLIARLEIELELELPIAILGVNSLREFYNVMGSLSKGSN